MKRPPVLEHAGLTGCGPMTNVDAARLRTVDASVQSGSVVGNSDARFLLRVLADTRDELLAAMIEEQRVAEAVSALRREINIMTDALARRAGRS